MNSVTSHLVKQHFDASLVDVTPALMDSTARILYIPVSDKREFTENCAAVLSDTETRRAGRFRAPNDAALFIQRRAFRRYCAAVALDSSEPLHRFVFSVTKNGRPHISGSPDIWFSFSSCKSGFLGAWSYSHGIGVDLEDSDRHLNAIELAEHCFAATEATSIKKLQGEERLLAFYQYWSLKEAALKSIGEGLPFGLDTFEFELSAAPRLIQAPQEFGGAKNFEFRFIDTPDSCAAVVTRQLN